MPLRLRRGTDSTRTSITPVQGEPIYTTDTKKLFIGDGTTAGGVEVGGTSVSNSANDRIITSDGTSTGLVAESNLSFNGTQLTVTGSVISPSFTGSLQGSSSYSIQSLSASFATIASTASYVLNSVSASFATNSSTASYILNAVSASFATTASYVLGGGGGATVTSSGNDRLITSDGTTGGLVGETNLRFNGSILNVTGSVIATSYTGSLQYFTFNNNFLGNYSNGLSIGPSSTYDNYSYGIGIGVGAYNNGGDGVGIGTNSYLNRFSGVGVGKNSHTNTNSGVGIGNGANNNYVQGVGIGYNSSNNYSYGVGIGSEATSNAKGNGTVAIGSNSKAERQNEFVTTATNSTTNKAQSIIQKFREISLASAGGSNQEIYTDASSARLTIQASSIYQFRIQINAIESTTFTCKSWEVVGAIKRNASNTTSIVGTPIYTVTSEEAGSTAWDVTVNADDTNEALRILVKHNATNNVTFSATIWATETRL